MGLSRPKPISARELAARVERIVRAAQDLGFVGRVEYRHVYSQAGGAQYGLAPAAEDDLLIVYAEAFERDANPEDFSLEAMIAHECGHQLLIREPKLRPVNAKFPGDRLEEVLASLVGSLLLTDAEQAATLVEKATVELSQMGLSAVGTVELVERLRAILRRLLS